MFDIGWSEMMVVGVVALIVVGPKDLPKMFHTLGEFTGKARGMAREFQRAMDAAAKESGVGDIARDFKRTASGKSLKEAAGLDDLEKDFRDMGRLKPDLRTPSTQTGKSYSKNGATLPPDPDAPRPPAGNPVQSAEAMADDFEAEDDEILAQDLARRNAEMSATEAERLKKVEKSEAARRKAADIRARREADAPDAPAPTASPAEAGTNESPTPQAAPKTSTARKAPATKPATKTAAKKTASKAAPATEGATKTARKTEPRKSRAKAPAAGTTTDSASGSGSAASPTDSES